MGYVVQESQGNTLNLIQVDQQQMQNRGHGFENQMFNKPHSPL